MKNIRMIVSLTCCSFLILMATFSFAGQGEFGLALKGGTLGAGLEGTIGILDNVNARLGFNYFSYEYDGSESGVDYDVDLDLRSLSLLVDWHPVNNGFRISAGALYNGNQVEAIGKASGGTTFSINDTNYTAADVGTLKGDIDFNSFAPYLGVGYGNAVGKDKTWNFVFDLGVMYQGEPDVSFSTTGALSNDASFLSDLEAERQQLESEIEDFQFYPVLSFGISYKF